MNLFLVYAEFFKIGLFSVGGGLATLPFLYNLAARYDWIRPEDIGNFLAIAQCSPGAIGVNTCAQTGYLAYGSYPAGYPAAGILGAIIAPLALVSPAIIVILVVARILAAFKENTTVQAVFGGLRPAAVGLISAAGFGVITLSLYSAAGPWYDSIRWKEIIVFAVIFTLIRKFKKHPVLYIAAGGIAGVLLGLA